MELPANSAGIMCPFGRCAGKLNGPNMAKIPIGLWRVTDKAFLRE